MTTKKKSKTKIKTKTKRVARRVATKTPPKTLFAAIDPQGSLRFSSATKVSVDAFVGKLGKFYRVEMYDLRIAKKEKRK